MTVNEVKEEAGYWLTDLVKQVGFPIVVASALMFIFFESSSQDRERIIKHENYIRDTLMSKLDESTAALKVMAEKLEDHNRINEKLSNVMDKLDRRLEQLE